MERKTPRSSFGPYGMAEHRGEDPIRIVRIDGERRDLLAVAQAEVRPGAAGVGRSVDAVAHREVGALQPLAAADVDDVRIRRRHRDRADRLRRLVVEDGLPGAPVVVGPPDAAVADADVEDIRMRPARRPGPACARRGTARSCASASP